MLALAVLVSASLEADVAAAAVAEVVAVLLDEPCVGSWHTSIESGATYMPIMVPGTSP